MPGELDHQLLVQISEKVGVIPGLEREVTRIRKGVHRQNRRVNNMLLRAADERGEIAATLNGLKDFKSKAEPILKQMEPIVAMRSNAGKAIWVAVTSLIGLGLHEFFK